MISRIILVIVMLSFASSCSYSSTIRTSLNENSIPVFHFDKSQEIFTCRISSYSEGKWQDNDIWQFDNTKDIKIKIKTITYGVTPYGYQEVVTPKLLKPNELYVIWCTAFGSTRHKTRFMIIKREGKLFIESNARYGLEIDQGVEGAEKYKEQIREAEKYMKSDKTEEKP